MIYYTNRWGAVHYPLVGPNIKAFLSLVKKFPKTHFYALQSEVAKRNVVLGWFGN